MPVLSAEGGYQRFLDDQRLAPARYNGEPGIFGRDIFRGELVLKLPLFTGGRIINEIKAAELLRQSAAKQWGQTRAELVFNVTSTFYSLLGQREVIHSLKFSATAMAEHRKQVSALVAAQKAARVDLLRTEVRLADLRQSLVREENILAVENRLLANLLGIDFEARRFAIKGMLIFVNPPDMRAADLLPAALAARGDYLAAKAGVAAQEARVAAAKAGSLPNVSFLGSYGARATDAGDSADAGAVGLGVSVPLFEGGKTAALVAQERAVLNAAKERLRKLSLQIRQEVEIAVLDIQSSGARAEATRLAIAQARETLRIERLKYDLGSGSMTDVLDAQSALLQSETNYARVLADLHIATARLGLATGENAQ